MTAEHGAPAPGSHPTDAERRTPAGEPLGHQREAQERWGDTDAWAQSTARTRRYGADDWARLKAAQAAITARQLAVWRDGAEPGSEAAMDAAEAHRAFVTAWFYDCSPDMHAGIGGLYVSDPRYVASYDDGAGDLDGFGAWLRDAMTANAVRQA